MTSRETLLELHDLDLLLFEARDLDAGARLRRAGLGFGDPSEVEKARARVFEQLDPRWRYHYARALTRYGGAIASVRARVCQGCFISLPRSAAPGSGESLTLCESCGRILYWGPREPS
ncbi:MAG: hypothetical protein HYR73_00165 [Candidatus Eisenbacteria bacterium]|nr:hypothetical protein [Candidatus Eisenbacteria bacterium]